MDDMLDSKGFLNSFDSPLYRNSLFILINQSLFAVIGLAFWLLAARQYPAGEVGLGSATISAMILLSYLGLLGIDYAVMRFLPGAGPEGRSIINTSLTLGISVSAVLAVVFIAGIRVWSPTLAFLQNNPAFFAVFVVGTGLWTGYWINGRVGIGKRRAHFTLAQGLIFNVLRLALVIALAAALDHFGIFLAWGTAGAAAFLIGLAFFTPRLEPGYRPVPGIRWRLVVPMVRYALANYAVSLLWFGGIYIMPLIVINLLGEQENAYFFIAWQLVNIIFAVPIAVSFSLTVEGAHDEPKLERDTRRSLLLTLGIVVPAILLVVFLAEGLLGIFGQEYSENAAAMLRIAAITGLPVAFNQIYFGVKRVQLRMRSTLYINAFTTPGALLLSYFLLGQMGITGAGIAWVAVHGAAALATFFLWYRESRISGIFGRVRRQRKPATA